MTRGSAIARLRLRVFAGGMAGSVLALVAGMAAGAVAPMPSAERAPAFQAPRGAQVLTRLLRRQLGDGAVLEATRRYAVTFTPVAGGYRVDGRQIDVRIDAPARLAALAAIERGRQDDAMFPILLDVHGQIVAFSGRTLAEADGAPGHAALREIETAINASSIDDGGRAQALQAARLMAGRVTRWPRDLFRPTGAERSETRALALPDGGDGTVTVAIRATLRDDALARFERTVTTSTGGEPRTSTETWWLGRPSVAIR
ncbi:MAG: hypothetical protein KGM17_06525 [Sphingomonadales bacterium]|nr:hypothetical protein [Sphingomonadales bacterium]